MQNFNLKRDFVELATFLSKHGWHRCHCKYCGEDFFSKSPEATSCNWRQCNTTNIELLKPKHPRSLEQVKTQIVKALMSRYIPYNIVSDPLPIVNESPHTTDLTIAGVQIFDDIIHDEQNKPLMPADYPIIIAQPVIRSLRPTDNIDDCSSSFVNICLERRSGTYAHHLKAIDNWIAVLSSLGLHANYLHLRPRYKKRNWGEGDFIAEELFFVYGGLELGDASWTRMPTRNNGVVAISDLGFGLERIAQIASGNNKYQDALRPAAYNLYPSWTEMVESIDSLRTLCLLIIDENLPDHKSTGPVIKKFAETVSKSYYSDHLPYLFECADFYYYQWIELCYNELKHLVLNHDEFMRQLRLAIDEKPIRNIRQALGLPKPNPDETLTEYSERMVYVEHATSLKEIRRAFDEHR